MGTALLANWAVKISWQSQDSNLGQLGEKSSHLCKLTLLNRGPFSIASNLRHQIRISLIKMRHVFGNIFSDLKDVKATKFRNGGNENGFLQLRSVSDIFNATTEFSRKRNSRNFGKSFGCIGSETEKIGTEFLKKLRNQLNMQNSKHISFASTT